MTAIAEDPPRHRRWTRILVAALAPLAGVALAYLLWWISDRLLYIGPFDRATFGWLVVVPVWALAPLLAAYAWRTLNAQETVLVAVTTGLVISVVAALLFWLAIAAPDCEFGAIRSAADSVLPSVIVGAVIGGGLAAACVATAIVLRGRGFLTALATGAGSGVVLVFLAILAAAPFVMTGGCQRPPMG